MSVTLASNSNENRQRLSFDPGWRFHLGDIPFPVVSGHGMTYQNAKAGVAFGAAAPDFDDSDWRVLDLPHDWAVEGPFDEKANLSQGYRPRGFGWYRKHFKLEPADQQKHLELQFDGVATHCTVWFNGTVVHRNWCGYTSFSIDITPFAKFDGELNHVVVQVDATPQEGWWYEGAGIYRHTWLVKRAPVHIVTDGVFAQPVKTGNDWSIPVEVTLNNIGHAENAVEVESILLDPAGKEVARGNTKATVAELQNAVANYRIAVAQPQLWSVDQPRVYTVRTTVSQNGATLDEAVTHCGFRTIRFDADKGFFLNDQPLRLQGTCNHIDHAGVGVAVPDSIWDFRIRKLKEMGSNAYRCAHNPPAQEFLDACDRLGMLVMDENRNFNPTPEYQRQLEWMVRRDRNHPSIILWSVFNEEPMQGTPQGYEMVRRMSVMVKNLDTTRPVTAAMSGGMFNPVNVSQAVDVVGFNYTNSGYDNFHKEHPTFPMTSSEDTSALMTRGEYFTDKSHHILASYDTEHPGWGTTHRASWKAIGTRPFLAGAFVWTGFDYRGEPTPFAWPSVSSFFGCMDTCGFPKMAFYLHQAQWIKDRPILQIVPHWNWPGREGQPIQVMALSNADTVALSLNGKLISELSVDPFEMVTWQVPYAPGKLEAVGKKAGVEVSRCIVETTSAPIALQLLPDRTHLAGDGQDAVPVNVQVLDQKGRPVPDANFSVEFQCTGPGTNIGTGNGDPNSHEPEKENHRSLFNGLAQIILQSKSGGSGPLTLRATAPGMKPAEITLQVDSVSVPPVVAGEAPVLKLSKWRISPASATKPDPNSKPADNDQNSWANTETNRPQKFEGFVIYRAPFQPFSGQKKLGAKLVFGGITGKAEVWIDGTLAATKTTVLNQPFTADVPPGDGSRFVNVLIEAKPGQPSGLTGPVTLQAKP